MDRTNITDTGYTYGGQNFTKQSRVDGMGNSYTVDVPSAISVSSLSTPQTPITVTQPNYNVAGYQADGNKASSYLQSSADTAQANVDQINKNGTAGSAELSNLQLMLGGKSEDLQNAYSQKDQTGNSVNSLAGQLRSYNAQSQALNYDNLAKTLAEQNKATGQNITSTAVSRNTADATRENTINIAKLAMQSAITQADYTTAKEAADTIINAKYDKITAEIEAEKTNLAQLDKYQLTPAQDKAKAAREALLRKQEQDAADKKDKEKQINDLIINANQQQAPKDAIIAANKAYTDGKSPLEVANILGVYAGDYRKALLLNEQLKTEKLQQANISANIRKTNMEAGLDPVTGKPTSGAPTTFKSLTESQGRDLTYAQRSDQANSIIDNLQGDITKMSALDFQKNSFAASNGLTNKYADPKVRQLNQAEKNFLTAVLRRESGAQIAPSEMADGAKIYFARPGDDPATLAAKKQARDTAIASFKSNVPQYDQRVQSSVSVEDKYLDSALNAVNKVNTNESNPYSNYVVGLQVRN